MRYFLIAEIFLCIFCLTKTTVSSEDVQYIDKVERLLIKYEYSHERHYVETSDGYKLKLHRIVKAENNPENPEETKKVAFLQHGILGSSADWLFAGRDKSLAIALADEGYDVWMGNARGNIHSQDHKTLDHKKNKTARREYWNFSWHEVGTIDVPSMIDYILETTNQKQLFYVGHNLGTTAFYVMLSEKPEYNSKIEAHFSLSPAVYMGNIGSPILQLLSNFDDISLYAPLIGLDEYLNSQTLLSLLPLITGLPCTSPNNNIKGLCDAFFSFFMGFDDYFNHDSLVAAIPYIPAGASIKELVHFSQIIKSGQFRQFDDGAANYLKYKSMVPPSYNLKNVEAPVYLMYSRNDWISSGEGDVFKLCEEISNCTQTILIGNGNYNYLDFLANDNIKSDIVDPIIELMKTGGKLYIPTTTTPTEKPTTTTDNSAQLMKPLFTLTVVIMGFILRSL